MDDGKINKDRVFPEEIQKPKDLPDMEKLLKGRTAKILKKEDLGKTLRGPEHPDFKTPTFESTPTTLGFKDILDKDGRRHIEIRDINRGKILKIKDL